MSRDVGSEMFIRRLQLRRGVMFPSVQEWPRSEAPYEFGCYEDDAAAVLGEIPVIYYLEAGAGGPIKIGYTRKVFRRLEQLQTACPDRLALLAIEVGSPEIEKFRHQQFKAYRLNGEWFERAPILLAYIRDIRRARYERWLSHTKQHIEGIEARAAAVQEEQEQPQ